MIRKYELSENLIKNFLGVKMVSLIQKHLQYSRVFTAKDSFVTVKMQFSFVNLNNPFLPSARETTRYYFFTALFFTSWNDF
jgi:hypothetical protein